MARLTDVIERFIKEMLDEQTEVELKRNELATFFDCAPSQINYVLTSRFTFENGYLTQSKRGGGGYIRIVRLQDDKNYEFLLYLMEEKLAEPISEKYALKMVESLSQRDLVSEHEAGLLSLLLQDDTLGIPSGEVRDLLRQRMLKKIITQLLNIK